MNKVAFAFSSKDRCDFTAQTLPRILDEAEDNFDLFWLDGSVTNKGKVYPYEFALQYRQTHEGKYPLTQLLENIGGGAAAVIVYALQNLYQKGYEYIGLIENDVLLEPGWFKKTFELFNRYATVGAVSARCFKDRTLVVWDDHAVMANIGAGMILFKREVVMPILENWQQPKLWEVQALCKYFLNKNYPIPKAVLEQDPELKQTWQMVHDWWFEPVLWSKGYTALATVPSMARNLDDPGNARDPLQE